jgi:hypothetical protein
VLSVSRWLRAAEFGRLALAPAQARNKWGRGSLSSLRCKHCGLINFAMATDCKRCGVALHDYLREDDGGALASDGVWQAKGLLVMRTNARLDDYCIKCNSAEVVTRRWVTASSYAHWTRRD